MPLPESPSSPPVVGGALTWRRQDASVPATILRISRSGSCLWFECEKDHGKEPRMIFRALRCGDGQYREDHDCWPVDVGVREEGPRAPPPDGAYGDQTLAELTTSVERIEPWLRKTRWYPMTYMMIPSVLASADELLFALAAYPGNAEAERLEAQRLASHLAALRGDFHRAP